MKKHVLISFFSSLAAFALFTSYPLEAAFVAMEPEAPSYVLNGVTWQPITLKFDNYSCSFALPPSPYSELDEDFNIFSVSGDSNGSHYEVWVDLDEPDLSRLMKTAEELMALSAADLSEDEDILSFELKLIDKPIDHVLYTIECKMDCVDGEQVVTRGYITDDYHFIGFTIQGKNADLKAFDTFRIVN